jgi:hypothetical protein
MEVEEAFAEFDRGRKHECVKNRMEPENPTHSFFAIEF